MAMTGGGMKPEHHTFPAGHCSPQWNGVHGIEWAYPMMARTFRAIGVADVLPQQRYEELRGEVGQGLAVVMPLARPSDQHHKRNSRDRDQAAQAEKVPERETAETLLVERVIDQYVRGREERGHSAEERTEHESSAGQVCRLNVRRHVQDPKTVLEGTAFGI